MLRMVTMKDLISLVAMCKAELDSLGIKYGNK